MTALDLLTLMGKVSRADGNLLKICKPSPAPPRRRRRLLHKRACFLRGQTMTTKRGHFDDAEQSKLFIEKARELGADTEEAASDKLMGHLAKMPPQPHKKPKRRGAKPAH